MPHIIIELDDNTFGLKAQKTDQPQKTRQASRAIIIDSNGDIALIYTEKHGHHKIPGGGIEDNESWQDALKREALEEAACEVDTPNDLLGITIERKAQHNAEQTSYCAIAYVTKKLESNTLTQDEILDGYGNVIWLSPNNALDLMKKDTPKTYLGKFMHKRDMAILEYAISQLKASNT